jgi:hypothetical protein
LFSFKRIGANFAMRWKTPRSKTRNYRTQQRFLFFIDFNAEESER